MLEFKSPTHFLCSRYRIEHGKSVLWELNQERGGGGRVCSMTIKHE